MKKIVAYAYSTCLSLRYRLEIRGRELLTTGEKTLFLANHQALVDPQILVAEIHKYTTVAPVIAEQYYNMPLLKTFFRWLGAVPVKDIKAGVAHDNVIKHICNKVLHALDNGSNVLLYPSGQLCAQGYEKIFNKRSAYILTAMAPDDVRIVGVRITGLWGSMWSKASCGRAPSFLWTYLKAVFYVLANLVVFVPKRMVLVEFEELTEQARAWAEQDRKTFNSALEVFYNKAGEETQVVVKHLFYGRTRHR